MFPVGVSSLLEVVVTNQFNMHYIDIETVSRYKCWADVPEREQKLFRAKFKREIADEFDKRCQILRDANVTGSVHIDNVCDYMYKDKAGLHAEFNKIVCISMGMIRFKPLTDAQVQSELQLNIDPTKESLPPVQREDEWYAKSFTGHDEKMLLMEFAEALKKGKVTELCAHNGKRFDYPQLSRKFIMYGLPLPKVLSTAGKKPWEITFQVDTMEMWGFGEYKYTCSLDLLAYSLGLPSPKANLDGSQVGPLYWSDLESELPLKQIASYCETDIFTCCNVHRVLNYLKPLL